MLNRERTELPLLAPQLRTWMAQSEDFGNPVYCICDYVDIRGPVDPETMQAAHEQVEREAEALRLVIVSDEDADGGHRQFVKDDPAPLPYVDLSTGPAPEAAARAWMEKDAEGPVDPQALCRAALLKIADDHFVLYRRVHHAVVDGYSLALVFNRTAAVYSALARQLPAEGGAFPAFAHLVETETAYRDSRSFPRDRAHWLDTLAGHPEPVGLSGRRGGLAIGRRRTVELTPDRVGHLERAAADLGVTWSDLAVSTIAAYVGKHTGADELLLGLPTGGRLSPQVRNVPGMTMNILPLRLTVDTGLPLGAFTRRVSRTIRNVLLHSRYPTAEISREVLGEGGGRLWGPMVNVMKFDYKLDFGGSAATMRTLSIPLTIDMTVYFFQTSADGTTDVILDAHPELFTARDTDAHLEGILGLLDAIGTARPETAVRELFPPPAPVAAD
ncbi:condensation domain-containing protein [Streptomyces silvensis]|uniref:condensation domain-containing protein n=1 Tax=Streptomyces silvensis TaxID=1765722 RepID=UPI000AA019E3|nr:condensation domain-containing protein [Streptomyces silvensis]